MRDHDVRVALRARLDTEHAEERDTTLIVDELGLCGLARVDVAVVNGALTGYELKSERDRLDRLPNQVRTYGLVLDHAYLVVAERHLKSARALVPNWWGILVASGGSGSVELRHGRLARRNRHVDPHHLAQLLWRGEALEVLHRHGLDAGVRTKPRHVLWQRLAGGLDLDVLRAEVRQNLKARREWRESPAPRESVATSPSSGTTPRFLARRLP
ncbi:sce7726 family protein [Aeromicrobium sp. 9AM]|uniref:sce7726 family protein n=1 Tax=Aeromicrobium sp. 9AM TaxID=2653126 RepID=UPI00135AA1AC